MILETHLRAQIRTEQREYLLFTPQEFSLLRNKPIIPERHLQHLRKSRRLRGKIPLTIANGEGVFLTASLSANNILQDISPLETIQPRHQQVVLAQAIIHHKNIEWLTQKTTELGVDRLVFFKGDFSSYQNLNLRRLGLIVENAMMQSLNFFRPLIEVLTTPLEKWHLSPSAMVFYGSLTVGKALFESSPTNSHLIFINGPEGGFSAKEQTWLAERGIGLNFSPQILRSETAAICAIFYLKALTF